ncbi:hypothetical protein Zmor_010214 [Zophobas morio]|uniref:Uncharacterized protein n=1 Tax=Zophobas morio TaxID=2755281 RepID=A0AA38MJF8_9CUCU|nr:hypothetical protein Zmor_010214 [Zophobas morio]
MDQKRNMVMEMMANLCFVCHNTGDTPTFQRNGSELFIDIICATSEITNNIKNWKVLEQKCLSGYKYIHFQITGGNNKKVISRRRNFSIKDAKFRLVLRQKARNLDKIKIIEESFEKARATKGRKGTKK